MTTLEERYEGNYLDAIDLPEGAAVTVEIEEVFPPGSIEDARRKPIDKAILRFKGKKKQLILNQTNYSVLKSLYGLDWVGNEVTLQRRYVQAFGRDNEPAIRIIPPKGHLLPRKIIDRLGTATPCQKR